MFENTLIGLPMTFNEELATPNMDQRSITDDTPEAQAPTILIKPIKKGIH